MSDQAPREPARRSVSLVPGLIYEWTPEGDQPIVPVRDADPTSDLGATIELAPQAEVVPGYRLVERIGAGCTGEVWRAIGPGGAAVALKFIEVNRHGARQELRSLESMLEVRHANLVSIFGIWERPDWTVIGMDLADGSLLNRYESARERGQPGLDPAELLDYLGQAARGIDFLNDPSHPSPSGPELVALLHRDIKPQNLLLAGGSVKVGDFGLVERWRAGADSPSRGGDDAIESLVTAYTAPEIRRGRLSGRADQYSLAATYCHLRGGRAPTTSLADYHASEPTESGADDPAFDLSMLPVRERSVVTRALAIDPADRWATCGDFIAALLAMVEQTPSPTPPPKPAARPDHLTARRRSRRAPLLSGFALLLLVPFLVWLTQTDKLPSGRDYDQSDSPATNLDAAPVGAILQETWSIQPAPNPEQPLLLPEPGELLIVESPGAGPIEIIAQPGPDPEPTPDIAELLAAVAGRARASREEVQTRLDSMRSRLRRWVANLPRPEPRPEPVVMTKPPKPTATPKTATIIVRMPSSKAELVVRGEVGRGNPDEWYGPRRVIHSPPLTEPHDYLVGAFWTEPGGQPLTRSKPLTVEPGRLYEVDLRAPAPTVTEVPRPPSL